MKLRGGNRDCLQNRITSSILAIIIVSQVSGCGRAGNVVPDQPAALNEPALTGQMVRKITGEVIKATDPIRVTAEVLTGEVASIPVEFTSPWPDQKEFQIIQGTCSCTDVTLDRMVIRPGEQVLAQVVYDSRRGQAGEQRVIGICADGRAEELPFVIDISHKPGFVVDRWGVDFGEIGAVAQVVGAIPIQSMFKVDESAVRFEDLPDRIEAELKYDGQRECVHWYTLTVKLSPNHLLSDKVRNRFKLVAPDESGLEHLFEFQLTGETVPPISVTPARGFIGALTVDDINSSSYIVRSAKPITVLDVECPAWVSATIDTRHVSEYEQHVDLRLQLLPGQESPLAGVIEAKLTSLLDGEPYLIVIPLMYAAVRDTEK